MSTRVFIVCGEPSGDHLGAGLMRAMQRREGHDFAFSGVGGPAMEAAGFTPLFPLDEITVMGPLAIAKAYRRLRRRALECVAAGVAANPDLVIIIDAPEFTHPVAKRIRKQRPDIPIVDYVSPTVWAWRPGRAAKMRAYVDHVLALLPFEPAAHARLGGPPCTYVGHPLVERRGEIRGLDAQPLLRRLGLARDERILVVLPGSRSGEVARLLPAFGETVARLRASAPPFSVIIPAVTRHEAAIRKAAADWDGPVHVVTGEADKWQTFHLATAALAASGTVTLELGVAGVPMVVAYKVDPLAAQLRFLVNVPSIVLANLVLDERAFPEFIQQDCNAATLAGAVAPLLSETPARRAQLGALERLDARIVAGVESPSEAATDVVLDVLAGRSAGGC
ncbi:MAG: lipid-A-disaccharide synthase [Pseudomonadota bacterium]